MSISSICLLGFFQFHKGSRYAFSPPFRRGLRPAIWLANDCKRATSFELISNVEIHEGEKLKVEIAILNELEFAEVLVPGTILAVGTIVDSRLLQFAEYQVLKHLGKWPKTIAGQ